MPSPSKGTGSSSTCAATPTASLGSGAKEPEQPPSGKKAKKVELADAVPAEYEKESKALTAMKKGMDRVSEQAAGVLVTLSSMKQKHGQLNPAGQSYERTVLVRQAVVHLWLGINTLEARATIQQVMVERLSSPSPAARAAGTATPTMGHHALVDLDKGEDKEVHADGEKKDEEEKKKKLEQEAVKEEKKGEEEKKLEQEAVPVETEEKKGEEEKQDGKSSLGPRLSALTRSLREAAQADGSTKIPVNDVKHLFAYTDMLDFVELVIDIETIDLLQQTQVVWRNIHTCADQLRTAAGKSVQRLSTHLAGIEREHRSSVISQQKEVEKKATAKAKANAKAATQRVEETSLEPSPLFLISPADLETHGVRVVKVSEAAGKDDIVDIDLEVPQVVKLTGYTAAVRWSEQPKVQMALSTFGGDYKTSKHVQAEGKGQLPMMAPAGKTETDIFFKAVASSLGIFKREAKTESTPAQGIISHTWMWGILPGWDRTY